jgi:hypothetical protein
MPEIIIVLVGVLVLVYVVLRSKARAVRARHRRRVAAAEPEHSAGANLIGIASEQTPQIRGLGTLVLGRRDLVFVQLLPEREIVVPRDAVTSTRTTRHFLGKTTGSDLLVVTWEVEGLADAAAFAVADLEVWRDRLG